MNLLSRIVTVPFALVASTWTFAADEIDFAKGLARDGYVQEAEEVCRRIEAGGDAKEKVAVPLVRAEISARRAAAASTMPAARAELVRGAEALDAFAAANPGHPRLPEALMEAGLMRRQCGELAEQEFREGGSATAAGQGRVELEKALKNLEAAGSVARARKQNIDARLDGKLPRGEDAKALEEADGQAAEASYQAARCMHLRARLETDAGLRKDWLEKANAAFMDLELDLGETPVVQEASLVWALVLRDLGRTRECLSRFEVAWSVSAPWLKNAAPGPLPAWEREVAERAAGGRAETYLASGEAAAALASVDSLLALVPNAIRDRSGFLALMEKGNALVALGRGDAAAQLALQLLAQAPSAAMKELASQKVIQWGGAGGAAAKRIVANAEYAAGHYQAAWDGYHAVLAAGEEQDPEILWRLGSCAEHLDRIREAIVFFETLASDIPPDAKAPEAAFKSAQLWNRLASAAGSDGTFEKKQVDRMLRVLTDRWPDDPNAQNAMYLVGEAAMERGEMERAALDFDRVPATARLYFQARVMAGRAWYQCASEAWDDPAKREMSGPLFDRAEERFSQSVESPGVERAANLVSFARLKLAAALLHPHHPRPAEALKLLEAAAAAPGNDPRATGIVIIDARIANGQPHEAALVARDLASSFGRNGPVASACRRAAKACDIAAEKEPAGAEALFGEAIELYESSVRIGLAAKVPQPDAAALADRALELALKINSLASSVSVDDAPQTLAHPESLLTAARLVKSAGSNAPPEGWTAEARLGLALGLSGDLEGARDAWGRIVEDADLLRNGQFIAAAATAQPRALSAYEELGFVHLKLASRNIHAGVNYDAALVVFANLVNACASGSRTWWRAKVGALRVYAERGKPGDFEIAKAGLADLKANHPGLDEGKFGIEAPVKALEKKLSR